MMEEPPLHVALPDRDDLIEQHLAMIRRFGGAGGLRDPGLLESAVGRTVTALAYSDGAMDAVEAGAMLCWTVIKNHPFIDGNKRAGYGALVTTLAANGFSLSEELGNDVLADRIIALAGGDEDYRAFHEWLLPHVQLDDTYRLLVEHDNGNAGHAPQDIGDGGPSPSFS